MLVTGVDDVCSCSFGKPLRQQETFQTSICIQEEFEDTKGAIRRRTDNTKMAKRKRIKGQTMIDKTYI